MKVITWNVNGLRAVHRSGQILPLVESECPDLLFLQEIKGHAEQFPEELCAHADYEIHYHSAEKRGYAGTGVWVRRKSSFELDEIVHGMPALTKRGGDIEGRIIGVRGRYAGEKMLFLGCYMPNGGKSDAAFEEKIIFYHDFLSYVEERSAAGEFCIWGGDLNVAHTTIDLARPKENDGHVGFHPYERAWLDKVVRAGWVDVFRMRYPLARDVYSWWSYRAGARENNIGWRIDCFFTKRSTFAKISEIAYLFESTGSDHCPVVMSLK